MSARHCPSTRHRTHAVLVPGTVCVLAVCVLTAFPAANAVAQELQPGDIILERQVTPRNAFSSVPKRDDPVKARAMTFPATTFDVAIGTLLSDADLTNAHGSAGLASAGGKGNAALPSTSGQLLAATPAGSNVPLGPGGQAQPLASLGSTISSTVKNSLEPLGTTLGGLR